MDGLQWIYVILFGAAIFHTLLAYIMTGWTAYRTDFPAKTNFCVLGRDEAYHLLDTLGELLDEYDVEKIQITFFSGSIKVKPIIEETEI